LQKLDARLHAELHRLRTDRGDSAGNAGLARREVEVVVRHSGTLATLSDLGLKVTASSGNDALGFIRLSDLEAFAAQPQIERVRLAGTPRPALDRSVPAINVPIVWQAPPGYKGRGVIVGIFDSGIDITHKNFRNPDGSTRILRLWDQTARPPLPPGIHAPPRLKYGSGTPIPMNYGAEYTKAHLDTMLAASAPPQPLPGIEEDEGVPPHGSHITGIAAGNGLQADGCHAAGVYVGVAPEADLVIVKTRIPSYTSILHGFRYIIHVAATASNFPDGRPRPVVINCSWGGPGVTDGARIAQKEVDDLLNGTRSRAIVASAGNRGNADIHVRFSVPAGGSRKVAFRVLEGIVAVIRDRAQDALEFSYNASAQLECTLESPRHAQVLGPIAQGDSDTKPLDDHDVTFASTAVPNALTGRQEISVVVHPANQTKEVLNGIWTLTFTEKAGHQADVDGWIQPESGDLFPRFVDHPPDVMFDPTGTMEVPAIAKTVIAVGNFNPDTGKLEDTSALGLPIGPTVPAADVKPDLVAPGQAIFAPRSGARSADKCSDCSVDFYAYGCGTSQAAPHVAGVVALMFERNKTLSWSEIRMILRNSARPPKPSILPATALPNNAWGTGIVDAGAAVNLVTPSTASASGDGGGTAVPDSDPPTPMVPDPDGTFNPIPMADTPALWPVWLPGFARHTQALNPVLARSPALNLVLALVSTHVDEVRRLINSNKKVAAVWRRHGGPALVRHLLAQPTRELMMPPIVANFNVVTLLDQLIVILERYGDAALRADAVRYRAFLLTLPGSRLSDLDRLASATAVP
jgi:subtilisin family serine protease